MGSAAAIREADSTVVRHAVAASTAVGADTAVAVMVVVDAGKVVN
jgi:hypothetical protein